MSPTSGYTIPSWEAQNGSAQSNTGYASQVGTQRNDYYDDTNNYSPYPDQRLSSSVHEYPPVQSNETDQYTNVAYAHADQVLTQGDSRQARNTTSSTYPQHQHNFYTAAPVDTSGYAREISLEDVENSSARDSTNNQTHLTRVSAYPSNGYNARPYTPVNDYASHSPSGMHNQGQVYLLPAPPSPQAQRYIDAHTPEERIRLGLPRFEDQQQQNEYYEQQQQINCNPHSDSTSGYWTK